METYQKICLGLLLVVLAFSCFRGCSEQSMAKNWGGETSVTLEPNQKLMEVTWKDSSLWILTKDMSENDSAESYRFYEKDTIGMMEGCVYINEVKLSEEELAEYETQKKYSNDYYRTGNCDDYGHPVFISYDVDTGTYTLLKPYSYGDNGELVPAY